MSELRCAALIPCFEADENIAAVVRGALQHLDKVVVVDDGSTDRSAERASEAGAEVLRFDRNRGKGTALRHGMEHLARSGYSHVFSLDADGQHLPGEMPRLLERAAEKPDSLIIGVRQRSEGQDIDPLKRWANDFADGWVARATGYYKVADSQSGFRIYPLGALAKILATEVRGCHFEFESEILILAIRRGLGVEGVDVQVHYPPAAERRSHYRPWVDTIRIIQVVVPFAAGIRR